MAKGTITLSGSTVGTKMESLEVEQGATGGVNGLFKVDNNDTDKASNLLKESVKNLEYPNLKTEAYIMLARMETDSKKAMRLFNSAQKATISQAEKNYVSILKARRMINDNNKEGALEILDAIELESNAYQEMFEHTYGMASALN